METLHPAVAHFAIALPVVALVFQALYLVKGEKSYSNIAAVTLLVTFIAILGAYLTGKNDGPKVGEILSVYDEKGMHELKEHAELGLYLLIAFGVTALLKIVNMLKVDNRIAEMVVGLLLVASVIGTLMQGKEGGKIVYEHGTLFEALEMKDTLKSGLADFKDSDDNDEKIDILTEAVKGALKIEE